MFTKFYVELYMFCLPFFVLNTSQRRESWFSSVSSWLGEVLKACLERPCLCRNFRIQLESGFPSFNVGRASLVAQRLKRLPGMRETRVRSLGQEDHLEKEMATQSSTFAWRIPWREEPGRLQSMWSQRVGHDWVTSLSLSRASGWIYFIEV